MATREPDRSAWRVNYENKSLSGIEVCANSGEIVNFITILHQEVVKDKEAHRTVIRLDENSKPILPPKQTFEELIQAKRRQQAILFQHSTTTNSTNAILSNRAARRVVAAAAATASARNRSSLVAATIAPTTSTVTSVTTDSQLTTTTETPATTTALLEPTAEDQALVIPRIIRRPIKRRRWPRLTRNRRSATARRKNRERALERAAQQEVDNEMELDEEQGEEGNDDDKDKDGEDDQNDTQMPLAKQSPITESLMDTKTSSKEESPPVFESSEVQEASKECTDDEAHNEDHDTTIEDIATSSRVNKTSTSNNSSTTIQDTSPTSKTSRTRSGTSKTKKITKKRRSASSRSRRKKPSPVPGASDVKVVTSIKALCKQNPSLTEEDHKEVKMLLKSAEPGSSIILPNGTVIKKSRRGGARAGAGRKRSRPTPGTSVEDSLQSSRSPTQDDKHNREQESILFKKDQTPPISPRCSSGSPHGRKSISRSSKKSISSETSKEGTTKK